MNKPIKTFLALFALSLGLTVTPGAFALSTLHDIQNIDTPKTVQQPVMSPSYEIPPGHWSYKLIQKLVEETGLTETGSTIPLDGVHPITRTDMAVLIADLTGVIKDNEVHTPVSERDQAQFDILKEEFHGELNTLKARVEKVENSVQYLSSQVKQLSDNEKAGVTIGKPGPAQITGLVQVWDANGSSDNQSTRNFRLRRAEIGLKGELYPHWHYKVLVDPVRSTNILKDLYVGYTGIPHHEVRFGAFKPGLTYEGSKSSAQLDLMERAQITRLGDVREQGLAVLGSWKYLDYQLGLYNGGGDNQADQNSLLATGGRITVRPLAGLMDSKKWGTLELGSSFFNGQTGASGSVEQRDRLGFEARYLHPKFTLSSEYLYFQDANSVYGNGWYLEGLYNLSPKWQLVARYDTYNPNTHLVGDLKNEYTAGINYLIDKYDVRLSVNYVLFNDHTHTNQGSALWFMAQQAF